MFGDHEAISTAWPLVSFKLDGLLLPVSVSQIAVFAQRDQGPVRCRSICCWVSGPAPCCFFRSAGFYTAISCQPKDKLTDISVDCVVSVPYRSVRKKKERNKKYYACNSEQLRKKHAGLLLNSIKHASPANLKQTLILGKVATLGPLSLTFMRQPTCM